MADAQCTWTPEQVEEWVVRSCGEQGVPVKVTPATDPTTFRRVATLFGAPTPTLPHRSAHE